MQNYDFLSYFSFFLILLDKQKITFNELIKFLEHIVAEQTSKSEVRCVYNVFDPERKGQVPVIELFEALERMYGHNITVDEIETILSMGDRDKDGCLNEEGNYWKFQYLYQCSRWQPFTFGEDAKLPPF